MALAIIRSWSMLTAIVLLYQQRIHGEGRVHALGDEGHLCHLLQHHGIVHGFGSILAPSERPVVLHQHGNTLASLDGMGNLLRRRSLMVVASGTAPDVPLYTLTNGSRKAYNSGTATGNNGDVKVTNGNHFYYLKRWGSNSALYFAPLKRVNLKDTFCLVALMECTNARESRCHHVWEVRGTFRQNHGCRENRAC